MIISTFLTLGGFLLVLQTSLFRFLPAWAGKPDLLFILLIFAATNMKLHQGVILALLFGLFMEIFSGTFLGIYPLIYLLLVIIVKSCSKHMFIDEVSHQPVLVTVSYLFQLSFIYILTALLAPANLPQWRWMDIFLQLLILALLSLPCFRLYQVLHLFLEQQASRRSSHGLKGNRFT